MSAKNRDSHNRFRSITVGFRVSPEEQGAAEQGRRPVRPAQAGILLQEMHGQNDHRAAESPGIQGAEKCSCGCAGGTEADQRRCTAQR